MAIYTIEIVDWPTQNGGVQQLCKRLPEATSSIFIPFRRSSRESAIAGGIDLVTGWEKAKRRPRPGHCRDPLGKSGFFSSWFGEVVFFTSPKKDGKVKSESENSGKVKCVIFGGVTLSVSLSILYTIYYIYILYYIVEFPMKTSDLVCRKSFLDMRVS